MKTGRHGAETTPVGAESPEVCRLELDLDFANPTPLYHQIAQAVRWRIGTGAFPTGCLLPSLRDAAERLGVSYHTVRRAYAELARQGLVDPVRGDGTRVTGGGAERKLMTPGLAEFISEVAGEARIRFGLDAAALAEALQADAASPSIGGATEVVVVECNDHQCRDLARQLEQALGISAIPWRLDEDADPPRLPMIGTWFHQAEMRRRWPDRVGEMRFASLCQDEIAVDTIRRAAPVSGDGLAIALHERDTGTGRQQAADLLPRLGATAEIEIRIGIPTLSDVNTSGRLHVVAPRLWDDLPPKVRRHPRVLELRYVFSPRDLKTLSE